MSREKLLWGISGGLALLAATLAILLAASMQSAEHAEPTVPVEEGSPGEERGERIVARVGGNELREKEFLAGLQDSFGEQYARLWMERTVVKLEAQELGIQISRRNIDEELRRMQIGYDSETQFYRVMKEQLGLSEQDLRNDVLQRLQLESIATYNLQVNEADVEKYIQEHPEEFKPHQEIRYAQIVVGSSEVANKVIEELENGVDFSLLARDLSIDEATAPIGGDSGWVDGEDPFIPDEAAERLRSMAVGKVSPPLKLGNNQWLIVTLLGRRTIDPLSDSSVREQLRRELELAQAPSLFDVLEGLLKKYNAVDFLESD